MAMELAEVAMEVLLVVMMALVPVVARAAKLVLHMAMMAIDTALVHMSHVHTITHTLHMIINGCKNNSNFWEFFTKRGKRTSS